MKIYTKTGDPGETGLFAGARGRKNDLRVEAYGTVDELNSVLGVARSHGLPVEFDATLQRIQSELFVLGAGLACGSGKEASLGLDLLGSTEIEALEREIDAYVAALPELRSFILPTGSPAGAALHLARTVCRRAERRALDVPDVRHETVIYLNRLSDHLFVLARRVNQLAETPETPWSARKTV